LALVKVETETLPHPSSSKASLIEMDYLNVSPIKDASTLIFREMLKKVESNISLAKACSGLKISGLVIAT